MDHPKVTSAVVLAGGLGTRLQSEIGEFPKVLAPIGKKPFLNFVLDYLIRQGIQHVVLSVGYKWEMIRDQFGAQYGPISLEYAVESSPLGTGGGIRLAEEKITANSYFVLNGDTIFEIPLKSLSDFSFDHGAGCAIALKKMFDVDRYGCVVTDGPRIAKFEEKAPRKETVINGGIYFLKKGTLADFATGRAFSFEKDFLETSASQNKIFGKLFEENFIDIGVPEDYHHFIKQQH